MLGRGGGRGKLGGSIINDIDIVMDRTSGDEEDCELGNLGKCLLPDPYKHFLRPAAPHPQWQERGRGFLPCLHTLQAKKINKILSRFLMSLLCFMGTAFSHHIGKMLAFWFQCDTSAFSI